MVAVSDVSMATGSGNCASNRQVGEAGGPIMSFYRYGTNFLLFLYNLTLQFDFTHCRMDHNDNVLPVGTPHSDEAITMCRIPQLVTVERLTSKPFRFSEASATSIVERTGFLPRCVCHATLGCVCMIM